MQGRILLLHRVTVITVTGVAVRPETAAVTEAVAQPEFPEVREHQLAPVAEAMGAVPEVAQGEPEVPGGAQVVLLLQDGDNSYS